MGLSCIESKAYIPMALQSASFRVALILGALMPAPFKLMHRALFQANSEVSMAYTGDNEVMSFWTTVPVSLKPILIPTESCILKWYRYI